MPSRRHYPLAARSATWLAGQAEPPVTQRRVLRTLSTGLPPGASRRGLPPRNRGMDGPPSRTCPGLSTCVQQRLPGIRLVRARISTFVKLCMAVPLVTEREHRVCSCVLHGLLH